MCSVATNLVTSLEFKPIRSATALCHFEQTRNGSLPTHSILLASTATNSATGNYIVVLECFGEHEEPAGSNKEQTTKKSRSVPKSGFERCNNISDISSCFPFFLVFFHSYSLLMVFTIYVFWENLSSLSFILLLIEPVRE